MEGSTFKINTVNFLAFDLLQLINVISMDGKLVLCHLAFWLYCLSKAIALDFSSFILICKAFAKVIMVIDARDTLIRMYESTFFQRKQKFTQSPLFNDPHL